jgi:hypothetical protein
MSEPAVSPMASPIRIPMMIGQRGRRTVGVNIVIASSGFLVRFN